MGDGREAGAFVGHTQGLTYVDSKGDGRYVLSNAKDQSMKLWDLRKMMTTAQFDTIDATDYTSNFDYRWDTYPDNYYEAHPHDCSIVTFRGHRVLKTLIRCHFSPPGSTNSRYVYTGSSDGKVYVYNLDATLAGAIDVGMATINSRPRDPNFHMSAYQRSRMGEPMWRTCVRDASWHPSAPVVAGESCFFEPLLDINRLATSWNGWDHDHGTCSVHSWNDSAVEDEGYPPVGKSYDSELEHINDHDSEDQPGGRSLRSRPVGRQYVWDDEDEEDW